ncbi:MAG: helix-turn-helix transcriptional regulator [Proteobacteria bacterium]|nr:helix-turn-helix transcriptional regulator [Pseudomonadota bacterium]
MLFLCERINYGVNIVSIKINNLHDLSFLTRKVRKNQSLDQSTLGLLSGNGITFISNFENGKETVEIGRVFKVLEMLGIDVYLDLPPSLSQKELAEIQDEIKNLADDSK